MDPKKKCNVKFRNEKSAYRTPRGGQVEVSRNEHDIPLMAACICACLRGLDPISSYKIEQVSHENSLVLRQCP